MTPQAMLLESIRHDVAPSITRSGNWQALASKTRILRLITGKSEVGAAERDDVTGRPEPRFSEMAPPIGPGPIGRSSSTYRSIKASPRLSQGGRFGKTLTTIPSLGKVAAA